MFDLLPDLVEEILSRVPAKSLSRFRFTCKRWNALLKDRGFTEKHFRKAPKQVLVLMLHEYSVNLHGIHKNFDSTSIEFKHGRSLNDSPYNSEPVDIFRVFHCDGLLLCTTKDNRLVVWNPCNGQTRWVQNSNRNKYNSEFALGYENNKSCHTYKILRCWNNYNSDDRIVGFEIYEFSSDSWRVLDDVDFDCLVQPNGVSLKGNAYWLALDEKQEEEVLVSFDFSTERFRRLCLPFPSYDHVYLSVVNEEQLSVLHQSIDNADIEIWVTSNDKIDQTKVLLWRQFLAIDQFTCPPLFKGNLSFFIDEEKKVAVCCDILDREETSMVFIIGEDKYRGFRFGESPNKSHWPFMFNYVPSLVQIQQGIVIAGRKKKERS